MKKPLAPAHAIMDAAVTEDAFLRQVIELAKLRHWLIHHCRPARTKKGWATPIQGDAGFPDLVLVREGRLLFVELKAQKGRVTPDQRIWLALLKDQAGFHQGTGVYLWKPSDWAQIEEVLR